MTSYANDSGLYRRRRMLCQIALGLLLVEFCVTMQCAGSQPIQRTTTWQPDPPKYGYDEKKDIPVRMDDGIVLRADEYFPVDPVSGAKVPGHFPVLLAETPYGKGRAVQNLADFLPWLDAEQAILIAVNRNPGDDVAIALDYRQDAVDPRIVASHWDKNVKGAPWEEIAPSFSAFVEKLRLDEVTLPKRD